MNKLYKTYMEILWRFGTFCYFLFYNVSSFSLCCHKLTNLLKYLYFFKFLYRSAAKILDIPKKQNQKDSNPLRLSAFLILFNLIYYIPHNFTTTIAQYFISSTFSLSSNILHNFLISLS